jgi:hypothetical protein
MVDERTRPAFTVCVANDGSDDLTTGMIYQVLPDASSARDGYLRVVDDSGDGYLYPVGCFVIVDVLPAEESRLLTVVPSRGGWCAASGGEV